MHSNEFALAIARPQEYVEAGKLMAQVYAQLDGFPSPQEQPAYYQQFENLGDVTNAPGTELVVAKLNDGAIVGTVIYIADMSYYGAGGPAVKSIQNAASFRLLAVSPAVRGMHIGRALTDFCIDRARSAGNAAVVIHSTRFMPAARTMYERIGFVRRTDIDFKQGDLDVLGFQYVL